MRVQESEMYLELEVEDVKQLEHIEHRGNA